MRPTPVSPNAIRFGLFEADLSAGELRKRGRKVPLQDQPFRVLTLLLVRPGEAVSREEFQRALWPGDTFVEFDEGLNKAIQKLRQALDDSSENPRFIETLPRKGYRFIAPVDRAAGEAGAGKAQPTPVDDHAVSPPAIGPVKRRSTEVLAWVLLGVLSVALVVLGGVYFRVFRPASRPTLKTVPLTSYPGRQVTPAFSPDGKQEVHTTDIWVRELARGAASRLTFDPSFDVLAGFSPDNAQIVFGSTRNGKGHLYRRPSNGAGGEEMLLESSTDLQPYDCSTDGRYVLYLSIDPIAYKSRLFVLPLTGSDRNAIPYLQTSFSNLQAKFSPDSKFVAYTSDESGRPEVYVQTFPASGGKWQISTSGGVQPIWRADGKELYYLAADRKLMAVPVKTSQSLEAGAPVQLFETRLDTPFGIFFKLNYAVSADGKRFLLATPIQATQQLQPIRQLDRSA